MDPHLKRRKLSLEQVRALAQGYPTNKGQLCAAWCVCLGRRSIATGDFSAIVVSQLSGPDATPAVTLNTGDRKGGKGSLIKLYGDLSHCLRAVLPLLPASLYVGAPFHPPPVPTPQGPAHPCFLGQLPFPACPPFSSSLLKSLPSLPCPTFPCLSPFRPSALAAFPFSGLCRGPLASPILSLRPILSPALRHCYLTANWRSREVEGLASKTQGLFLADLPPVTTDRLHKQLGGLVLWVLPVICYEVLYTFLPLSGPSF